MEKLRSELPLIHHSRLAWKVLTLLSPGKLITSYGLEVLFIHMRRQYICLFFVLLSQRDQHAATAKVILVIVFDFSVFLFHIVYMWWQAKAGMSFFSVHKAALQGWMLSTCYLSCRPQCLCHEEFLNCSKSCLCQIMTSSVSLIFSLVVFSFHQMHHLCILCLFMSLHFSTYN